MDLTILLHIDAYLLIVGALVFGYLALRDILKKEY